MEKRKLTTRDVVVVGMLSAVAFILEKFVKTPLPIMPGFIKLDFSEMPALVGAFALGPVQGVIICFIKNLLNFIFGSSTAGVGELSNFILGASFVAPAAVIYGKNKTKKTALIASVVGAVIMAVISVISNYYIVYPIYAKAFGGMENIIAAYTVIYPGADTLMKCLLIFNMPFTFCKGLLCTVITLLIYKRISPILKGKM